LVNGHGFSVGTAGNILKELANEVKAQKKPAWKAYMKGVIDALPPPHVPDLIAGVPLV